MPILNKPTIKKLLAANKLVRNPACDENGEFQIEAASYDLRVGTLLWQMIELVNEINAKFGDGKVHVTCWTCHLGSTTPEIARTPK